MAIGESKLPNAKLAELSTRELLDLLGAIGDELETRGHTRTGTSKLGELMEGVAATFYGGTLASPGMKGWDVLAPGGLRIQVKTRNLRPGVKRPFPFPKNLDFDIAMLVVTDITTHQIQWAREVGIDELRPLLSNYGDGYRLSMPRAARAGADVTAGMSAVYAGLD